MCGLIGIVDYTNTTSKEVVINMNNTLAHRGPDSSGIELTNFEEVIVALGHRRLSIIDLSDNGSQPMSYLNYTIVLNGEIYNYAEIKIELEKLGHTFKSNSDTEVVLHAFAEWSTKSVEKFNGMFAYVIFDKQLNTITAVRDRAGVKPLFYYWDENILLFASELKAFSEHPKFIKKVNNDAVADYFKYNYVSTPNCIFENAHKLNPASILQFNIATRNLIVTKYWSVYDSYNKPKLDISFSEALNKTEEVLQKAFNYRMVADVPVGAFLSGGYDSTSVVALLQKNSNQKINTFTIGVGDAKLNEAPFAKKIAKHLQTNHQELYCTEADVLELIQKLPETFDEPFSDASAIPTMLVSKFARKFVTVALSADAGDEVFAGYNRYDYAAKYLPLLNKVPKPIRKFMYLTGSKINPFFLPGFKNNFIKQNRYNKILNLLNSTESKTLIDLLTVEHNESDLQRLLVKPSKKLASSFNHPLINSLYYDDIAQMQAVDYETYLTDDIMHKVDRSTMSVALEGREPFLDHNVIEWAAQLPTSFKYKKGIKKYILKELVHKYVPKELMERPKMGFAIPIPFYLKTKLKDLLNSTLSYSNITKNQILNFQYVEDLKNSFFNGNDLVASKLWQIFIFQLWCDKWL